jgi:hypothetical protein
VINVPDTLAGTRLTSGAQLSISTDITEGWSCVVGYYCAIAESCRVEVKLWRCLLIPGVWKRVGHTVCRNARDCIGASSFWTNLSIKFQENQVLVTVLIGFVAYRKFKREQAM